MEKTLGVLVTFLLIVVAMAVATAVTYALFSVTGWWSVVIMLVILVISWIIGKDMFS
jgi:hypothetical protein